MKSLSLAVFTILFGCLVPEGTQGQPVVTRYTIDGGGGTSQAVGTSFSGTIGQPDAGEQAGGGYQLRGGFWVGAALSTPTPTPTVPPVPSGLDVKPDPLDQFIDALDLVEWLERTNATPPQGSADIVFEFALYWQEAYPPSKNRKTNE